MSTRYAPVVASSALDYSQLEELWTQAGGDPSMALTMAAIAEAESGGRPGALNLTDNGGTQTSWGLWQISNGTHSSPAPAGQDALDPLTNARLAVAKLHSQGLSAWGTYDTGAYRRYLQSGVAPSTTPVATTDATTTASSSGSGSAHWYEPWTWGQGVSNAVVGGLGHVALVVLFVAGGLGLIVLGLSRLFPGVSRVVSSAITRE